LAQIKEMVELPLRHPQLFKAIGVKVHYYYCDVSLLAQLDDGCRGTNRGPLTW